jgi:hypothetical protein
MKKWTLWILPLLFSVGSSFAADPVANVTALPVTATPTPSAVISIDLPIDANSMQGTIEFSDEKLDEGLKPRVIIMLDSSGSMGQILDKGKSKMFYAKKLFGSYLADQWREKAQVGMVVYGSRRKHDCSDTFMPFPIGERKVFDLEMFVTGIGLKEKSRDLDKLRCLGKTFGAPDSKSLAQALSDINNDINGKGPKSKNGPGGNNLYVEAPDPNALVKLYSLANGKPEYLRDFTAAYGVKIPPGEYMAEVMIDPMYTFKKFKIPPRKTVKLKVTGVGYLTVNFFNNLLDVEILNKDKKVVQSFDSDTMTAIKSGTYDIHVAGDPFF